MRVTEKQLKVRYPYLFAGPNRGIEFPGGWLGILKKLYGKIDAALPANKKASVWIEQQREKLGGLRVYLCAASTQIHVISCTGPGIQPLSRDQTNLHFQLAKLIRDAKDLSRRTCMICGAQGKLRTRRGWRVTLCSKHRRSKLEKLSEGGQLQTATSNRRGQRTA